MLSSRIRCLPAVIFVVAATSSLLSAQTPAVRARALHDRALELERQGNQPAALALLWEASGLSPHDAAIDDHLGAALERIGALDAAVEAYRAAAAANPPVRGAEKHLVLALVKSGRADEAIGRARAAAAQAPRDAERWFTLGLAQADVDVDGAVESFQRALALDRRHALARYNLALVLLHADRHAPALDALREAAAIEPTPEVTYTTGIVYWRTGDLAAAVKALEAAVKVKPTYFEAFLALGTILKSRGDLHGAAAALHRATALRPDDPAPHVVLAQTRRLAGDAAGAGRASLEADRLAARLRQSQEATTWTASGAQKLDAGDAAGAADCFRRATQALDDFAPAHYQLGRALERLGQHDAARAAFARARQLNPALLTPK
jgi:tetratricopeptide (TPR) repeat protein